MTEAFWAFLYDKNADSAGFELPLPVGTQLVLYLDALLEKEDLATIDRFLESVDVRRLDPVLIIIILNATHRQSDDLKNRSVFRDRAMVVLVEKVGSERAVNMFSATRRR